MTHSETYAERRQRQRFAALRAIRNNTPEVGFEESLDYLRRKLENVHDELTWENDVTRRYDEMRLGQWSRH